MGGEVVGCSIAEREIDDELLESPEARRVCEQTIESCQGQFGVPDKAKHHNRAGGLNKVLKPISQLIPSAEGIHHPEDVSAVVLRRRSVQPYKVEAAPWVRFNNGLPLLGHQSQPLSVPQHFGVSNPCVEFAFAT